MLVSHTSLFPSCQSRPASKAYQPPLATQACLHICCRPSTSPPLSAAPHPLILCNSSSSNCPLSKLLQGPMHCLIPVTFSDCATWRRHQQLQPASSLVLTYKRRSHAWVLHGPEGCAVVSLKRTVAITQTAELSNDMLIARPTKVFHAMVIVPSRLHPHIGTNLR